jgi:integrase
LFPSVHGTGRIRDRAMSGDAVYEMIRTRAEQAGYTTTEIDKLGGHSLRAGFVTEAFRAGSDAHQIMRQTGHRSHAVSRAMPASTPHWLRTRVPGSASDNHDHHREHRGRVVDAAHPRHLHRWLDPVPRLVRRD